MYDFLDISHIILHDINHTLLTYMVDIFEKYLHHFELLYILHLSETTSGQHITIFSCIEPSFFTMFVAKLSENVSV